MNIVSNESNKLILRMSSYFIDLNMNYILNWPNE